MTNGVLDRYRTSLYSTVTETTTREQRADAVADVEDEGENEDKDEDEDEEAGNAGAGLDARILRDLMTSATSLSRSRILLAMLGMTSNG